ncbi:hypothetical protein CsSME_00024736 [Camellia sinensis var. sinensis]
MEHWQQLFFWHKNGSICTVSSLSCAKLLPSPQRPSCSLSPHLHSKPCSHHSISVPFLGFNKNIPTKLPCSRLKTRQQRRNLVVPISASGAETTATDDSERWLLEPVGDGDSRHLGYKVSMPSAFEITSIVTIGRAPEKADMVIPVATVSGLHAHIQKKDGSLFVTDLDSTNGTFIGKKRLRPGVAATAPSGSYITFGDIHLAMFRVSKLENVEASGKSEGSESKPESEEDPSDNSETTG